MTSAASAAASLEQRRNKHLRAFITPEGVDLQLEIASAGLRFGALLVDLVLMLLILVGFTLILALAGVGSDDFAIIVWLLGFFLLRNFWFIIFELGPRAATPGKRLLGIRVVARDGGRLTVAAVVARNLVREVEMFLPFTFIGGSASEDMLSAGLAVAGSLWTLGMSFFLLFNRDRMRLGDLVGGTWVVMARKGRLAVDLGALSSAQRPGEPLFTDAELAVYGVFELQTLERVLRENNRDAMIAVADTIRAKLGRPHAEYDEVFLTAYYRQAKAKMERDLLFGKRRANKYDVA